MKFWKQLLISIFILIAAMIAWVMLDPSASDRLAQAGIPMPASLKPVAGATPNTGGKPAGGGNRGGGQSRAALVITTPVGSGIVNDRFAAIGTGAAIHTVTIQPQVSGLVSQISVSSGSVVAAGDVLVRLESAEQEIALNQAELAVKIARDKVARFDNLLKQRTISSVEAIAARAELESSELTLRQAELALRRRTITAPISGTIGILNINEGDYVTSQTVISNIDDRAHILIDFYVPERLVGAMKIGQPVQALSIARPGEAFDGKIIALDNRLDEASRTLRVQADIPNRNDRLRAGMSFQIRMSFPGEVYPSVDPLTIQWDSDGSYVWRIIDGKAEKVAVSIIQRSAEVVLVDAELETNQLIVTEGVQNVRNGGEVKIMDSENQHRPTADKKPGAMTDG